MNKASNKNPYEFPRVILASVSDEIQLDENLEPPFVRTRDTNSQYMELDTSQSGPLSNPARTNVSLARAMPRVNRIQVAFFAFRNYSPNINPRNNMIAFIDNGVPFVAVLPVDTFLIGAARYAALVAAMNTATGVPGEFTSTPGPFPQTFTITNTVGNLWRFDINQSVRRGRFLWGFNETNDLPGTEAVSHLLAYYDENYTRYVDIASYELTQYTKIDISGVGVSSEVLFRFFLTDVAYGADAFTGFTQSPSLNYDRSRAIASVDLNILDEFGDLLYIPQPVWGAFVLYIVMIASM